MTTLKRQNACHFFWDQGPPTNPEYRWTFENVHPLDLYRVVTHINDKKIPQSQFASIMSADESYCERWGICGKSDRVEQLMTKLQV